AFGMVPPWVALAAPSSDHTSCWHASPLACSAFCYHIVKDVRVLAVIVAIAELRQIQRQIVFAHLVIRANHATLEQAPKAIQVRGMDVPAHIFAALMADRFMGKAFVFKPTIAAMFISGDKGHILTYRMPYKALQSLSVHFLNDLSDDIALASNRANDG